MHVFSPLALCTILPQQKYPPFSRSKSIAFCVHLLVFTVARCPPTPTMSNGLLGLQILERLLQHKSLKENLQFFHIQRFFELAVRLWFEIVPPDRLRPLVLPLPVADFMSAVLELDTDIVQLTWTPFGDLAEATYANGAPDSVDDDFKKHGHGHELGAETLVPPMTSCTRAGCNSANLSEKRPVEARLYTRGILPVFSKSLYCRNCHTRYYHNYSVHEAKGPTAEREYYSTEVPDYIHVLESCYVERALCLYFETQLCLSHSTCEGIARVYNRALAHTSDDPSNSRLKDALAGDLVLESFFFTRRHAGQEASQHLPSTPPWWTSKPSA
ncbi:hypothetical protein C8R47DRAFT_639257 [Mycena vitilis]|nr:hypothetical protein C8R47DRAFT_639257 [Mycena vitilis]